MNNRCSRCASSNPKPWTSLQHPWEKENINPCVTSATKTCSCRSNTQNNRAPLSDLKPTSQLHAILGDAEPASSNIITKVCVTKFTKTGASVISKSTATTNSESVSNNLKKPSSTTRTNIICSKSDIKPVSNTTNKNSVSVHNTKPGQNSTKKTSNNLKHENKCAKETIITNTAVTSKNNTKTKSRNCNNSSKIITNKHVRKSSDTSDYCTTKEISNKVCANNVTKNVSNKHTVIIKNGDQALIKINVKTNGKSIHVSETSSKTAITKPNTAQSKDVTNKNTTSSNSNSTKVVSDDSSNIQKIRSCTCTAIKAAKVVPDDKINITFNKTDTDTKTKVSNKIFTLPYVNYSENLVDRHSSNGSLSKNKNISTISNKKNSKTMSSYTKTSIKCSTFIEDNSFNNSNINSDILNISTIKYDINNTSISTSTVNKNTNSYIDIQRLNNCTDSFKTIPEMMLTENSKLNLFSKIEQANVKMNSPVLLECIDETLFIPINAENKTLTRSKNNGLQTTNNIEITETDESKIMRPQSSKCTNEKFNSVANESECESFKNSSFISTYYTNIDGNPATSTPKTKKEIPPLCFMEKNIPKKHKTIAKRFETENITPVITIKDDNKFCTPVKKNQTPLPLNPETDISNKLNPDATTSKIYKSELFITSTGRNYRDILELYQIDNKNSKCVKFSGKSEHTNKKGQIRNKNPKDITKRGNNSTPKPKFKITTEKIDPNKSTGRKENKNVNSECITFNTYCSSVSAEEQSNLIPKNYSKNVLSKTEPSTSSSTMGINTTWNISAITCNKYLETIKEEDENKYFLDEENSVTDANFWQQFKILKYNLKNNGPNVSNCNNTQIISNSNVTGNSKKHLIHDSIPKNKTFKKDILKPSDTLGIVNLDSNTNKVHPLLLYPDNLLHDIMSVIILREMKNKLNFGFLGENFELCEFRSILVNWLVKLHQYLAPDDTCVLFMTIRLFDKILATYQIPKSKYQIYALATYWIALKDSCGDIVNAPDMIKLCNGKYSLDYFLVMEKNILHYLDYNMNIDEPMIFVYYFIYVMKLSNCNMISFCANYFLEILSLAHHCNCYPLSLQAASAVYLTLKLFNIDDSYWLIIKNHLGYYEHNEMLILHKLLIEQLLLMNETEYPYKESYKKFSHEKYEEVSIKVALKITKYI